MGNEEIPKIGITIGDINGIGPEIIVKALLDNRTYQNFTPIIYANGGIMSYYRKSLGKDQFNFHQAKSISQLNPKKVNVINVWTERVEVTPGNPNQTSGTYAKKSLEAAVEDLKTGQIDALVTSPFNKEYMKNEGFEFPGHTEYLASAFDVSDSLMLMVHEELRIAVVTGHIPLADVSQKITKETLESKLKLFLKSLKDDFQIRKPRIALLGLNPHAGENGMLGTEERDLIIPVIEEFKNSGNLVFGPYPADGFFGSSQYQSFDGVLAMYHDQGLIPFKHISQSEGVNFTAGLPVIRTSPAHGTAYNLAGKDLSNPSSMRNAIYLAHDLARNKIQETTE